MKRERPRRPTLDYVFASLFALSGWIVMAGFFGDTRPGRRPGWGEAELRARTDTVIFGFLLFVATLVGGLWVGLFGGVPWVKRKFLVLIEERILTHSDGTVLVNGEWPAEQGWRGIVRASDERGHLREWLVDPAEYALLAEGTRAKLIVRGNHVIWAGIAHTKSSP